MNQNNNDFASGKCEKCGSYDLQSGRITGNGVGFLRGDRSNVFNAGVLLHAIACKDCGYVFNFHIKRLDKLK